MATALFIGCSNDDGDIAPEDDPIAEEPVEEEAEEPDEETEPVTFADMESDWVRLTLVRDGMLEVMQADSGEIEYSVENIMDEGSRFYTSNSGRYLTVIDRDGGNVRFFDSGVEKHDDHGHEYEAKWGQCGTEHRSAHAFYECRSQNDDFQRW